VYPRFEPAEEDSSQAEDDEPDIAEGEHRKSLETIPNVLPASYS